MIPSRLAFLPLAEQPPDVHVIAIGRVLETAIARAFSPWKIRGSPGT
jgi:hypothetical protein